MEDFREVLSEPRSSTRWAERQGQRKGKEREREVEGEGQGQGAEKFWEASSSHILLFSHSCMLTLLPAHTFCAWQQAADLEFFYAPLRPGSGTGSIVLVNEEVRGVGGGVLGFGL